MRISEILKEGDPQGDPTVLLTTLELLRQHAHDKSTAPVINTADLISLVGNSGAIFSYDSLVSAFKTDPAIKQLIKSFNRDTVILSGLDGDDEFTTSANSPDIDLGTDMVARMAQKAMSKRN
jgi:hypothetical protein